jgi:hypothetical protein
MTYRYLLKLIEDHVKQCCGSGSIIPDPQKFYYDLFLTIFKQKISNVVQIYF